MPAELEEAIYTMRWSKKALDAVLELFNSNDIRNVRGERIYIELQDFGRGDVSFTFSVGWPEVKEKVG